MSKVLLFHPSAGITVTAFGTYSLAHMAHSAYTEFSFRAVNPRKTTLVHTHQARGFGHHTEFQDKPFALGTTNSNQNEGDIMQIPYIHVVSNTIKSS